MDTADDGSPAGGRARLIEIQQAQAWLALTRPEDYARWSRAVLVADLSEDGEAYERLQRETVALWREHRDDPMPAEDRRTVELAQAIAWLGDRHDATWGRATVLTVNQDERERDETQLIRYWRELRDGPELPGRVVGYVSSLARVREGRFEQAKDWHREHDPHQHSQWVTRRGYADTLGDEWNDDAALLRQWAKQRPDAAGLSLRERPARELSPFAASELDEDHGPARSL